MYLSRGPYQDFIPISLFEAGAWSCGMVAGLVSDIPTVQELIDRIMSEAEDIIASKLQKAI